MRSLWNTSIAAKAITDGGVPVNWLSNVMFRLNDNHVEISGAIITNVSKL